MMTAKKKILSVVLVLSAGMLWRPAGAAETSDIPAPAKRLEILKQAKQLLAVHEAPVVTNDPFHSQAFAELTGTAARPVTPDPAGAKVVSPRSPQDLLQAIAANLKPSGNFIMNGEHTLIFGQKRVKAGGTLTITFEGTEYTVEVTAIENNTFTLRLNREEFTRPIK
jgi:hypothetical protein